MEQWWLSGNTAEWFETATHDAPVVLLCHEWWGVNDDMRRIARRFADAGLHALVLDFYLGKSTTRAEEAMALVQAMRTEDAMGVVAKAMLRLRQRGFERIGITGFCLGGAMSIAAACTVEGIRAAVPYYGIPRPDFQLFSKQTPPILGHYGKRDGSIAAERVFALQEIATASGATFQVEMADAGHAFMREHDSSVYDAASASAAWSSTLAFFGEHLRG
jgi:carboxymethylenebutenolidase